MTIKTTDEIRQDFVTKSTKARKQRDYQKLLNNCTKADQKAIEMLESIDIASGGNLPKLYQTYMAIKNH
ncbi:MAG: hypothetical protein AAFQ80_15165 [Cyanobacteria bacterium J06621_8]